MAQSILCDACGDVIADMNNRASVLIYSPAKIADPTLDICGGCLSSFIDNPQIKKARKAGRARIIEQRAADYGMTPEEYLETQNTEEVPAP